MTYMAAGGTNFAGLARQIWYWPVIRGVIMVLFGLVALFAPLETPPALVQVFGIFVIVDGIASLIDGIRRRGTGVGSLNTGMGVVAIGFGLVLLFLPEITLGIVLILIALWAFIIGVFQLIASLGMRRRAGASWVWGTISGILLIALAIVCVVNPETTLAVMTLIIGAFAVAVGIAMIALGFRMRKLGDDGPQGPAAKSGPGEVIEGEIIEG
ncbi:Uncharacterized membrane protein HdeD, DUF308 family [Paraoerskovia marina]|uniref:Uncharacterized membrane protein HdeD, DUF308 family n=1 Tax=Paraoerskovia marina TaxID=545619 RepID=A0A1H1M4K9_9CELL|nr:HdeD family acid-resistance protein [Paraoerskovia marina]SDR81335.1 Uncharacterized membrane protein HdeD, DUF308 family [Paraoerskovia marina]